MKKLDELIADGTAEQENIQKGEGSQRCAAAVLSAADKTSFFPELSEYRSSYSMKMMWTR